MSASGFTHVSAGEKRFETQCCIAGGGPAGLMLGLLLARSGVDVLVLEKHRDFLRDFRGDTLHPSTLELMDELGLLDELLALPHQPAPHLDVQFGDVRLTLADFSHLPTKCKYIAFMPQWDFLDFIAAKARQYEGFRLVMEAEVTGLVQEGEHTVGVVASGPQGVFTVRTPLVVGADGRGSIVRQKAGLEVQDLKSPMDVLWLRVARSASDPEQTMGRAAPGRILVMIDRTEYWQCAYVIEKGGYDRVRGRGLAAFREELLRMAPFLGDRVEQLEDWQQVRLLTVRVDRLRQWYAAGVLCIGDAAHAMSPIGGVGINLAIQDAVAAANRLARPLRNGTLDETDLASVQRRRQLPTRLTQTLQLVLQHRVQRLLLQPENTRLPLPLPFRALRRFPKLRRIPGWVIGIGFRPEHVELDI